MPLLMNWGVTILLGWGATMMTRRHEELREGAFGWIFLALVAFESIIFTPLAIYLFRFYPHWSTHYLFDPDIYPRIYYWAFGLTALIILSNYLVLMVSYIVSRWLVVREHALLLLGPGLLGGLLCILDLVLYWPRIVRLADYSAYWAGGGELIYTHPAGLVGLLVYAAVVGLLLMLRRLYS